MMTKFIYIFLIGFFIIACKKDETTINLGYQYFPVKEGLYKTYQVMSIVHDNPVNVHDTTILQIKETIGEAYTDEEGETAHKLYRYKRFSDTSNWQIKDVWSIKLTSTTAEVVEENKRRIKMAFAISYTQKWNGNALNNDDKEECYYTNIAEPYTLDNGITYDSTVIVEHLNNLNYIEYLRHYEIYAANVGMIYSVNKNININNGDTLNIEKGTEIYYSLIDYGQE